MRRILFLFSLLAYFSYFCGDSLNVFFAPDDMMNMGTYWRWQPAQLAAAQLLPWRGFYRPAGGLFYMPLFHWFGLNPAPYHLAILALLFAGAGLLYAIARRLSSEPLIPGLAALFVCYHAGLTNLTYNIAFVYDVLCGFFYLAAFLTYIRFRHLPKAIPLFVALYLCALNSKEMAVTLPAVLILYEWLFHCSPRPRAVRLFLLAAAALTLLSLYGKLAGPDALAAQSGYRPEFSPARVAAFQTRSLGDLLAQSHPIGLSAAAAIWFLVTWIAWRRPSPLLRFCWFWMLVTPLPIEFLEGRGGACLYIPFAGWALFLAVVLLNAARPVALFLAGEPLLCRLGRNAVFAGVLASAGGLWAYENQRIKERAQLPAMAAMGANIRAVLAQFDSLRPTVPPGSTVVFLNDPFTEWDMAFIADLWFRDRSLNIKLQRKTPLGIDELNHARAIFDFRDGRLLRLR